PGSRMASAQVGIRWYYRMCRRSGFHMGFHSSILYGWHTRIIRTLPESWPVNENVPAEAMIAHEPASQRRYWSPVGAELGWSFNGRIDLSIAAEAPAFDISLGSSHEYYGEGLLLKGLLSIVIGRTGEAGTRSRP